MAAPLLRRALLYVPGSSKRMLEKSRLLNVDCITYDLEDSVTVSSKPAARSHIREILSLPRAHGIREQAVRVNSIGTGLALDDLTEVLKAPHLDTIVVPKVESPADVTFVANVLDHSNHPNKTGIKIIALLESARAIMDIRSICASSPRLSGLVFAAEDFALDLSLTRSPSLTEFLFARQTIVAAARAYNIPSAIDLVCTEYKDTSDAGALARECKEGAAMGFNGKQVIHPGQVERVQVMFLPSVERVRGAVRVLVADRKAEEQGRGSWALDGKMVDAPVVGASRRVVEKAELGGIDVGKIFEEEKGTVPDS
ncbi:uncharacterized protein LAJ45_11262 [Morchella importuna]|uniref:uncharacterized protein n=1 Tax=Morchella importuna TaxID=1174673 RepID=UPI001E8EBA8C|nr:uncharacterized protein LAJ45_11262 [Morchella importuna]KAH8144761.1 hypothetical protein LAJ45_11262 [Morchella importuna]